MDLDYLTHRDEAIKHLSTYLRNGNIVLFLGAGVSNSFGLPNWISLVNALRRESGLNQVSTNATSEQLQASVDDVRRNMPNEYKQTLKRCLYDGFADFPTDILTNRLFISILTLLMPLRRGNVKRIVSFNFDSIFEWALQRCGFDVNVIYQLPFLEGTEDINIYHPHGFLPHPLMKSSDGIDNLIDSDFVLFDLKQANLRLYPRHPDSDLHQKTLTYLRTGIGIFIGMSENSFDDRSLSSLFEGVGEENKNLRPTGFWFVNKTTYTKRKDEFIDRQIVPIPYETHEEIPDFILEVARHSAIGIVTEGGLSCIQ